MPLDSEIHFGFYGRKAVNNAVAALQIPVFDHMEEEIVAPDAFDDAADPELQLDAFEPLFDTLYLKITQRLGWTFLKKEPNGFYVFDTPYGKRETSGLTLCLQHDTNEVGDGYDDISLGFALSSRYYPAILDIKNSNGTMNSIAMEDYLPALEICKEEICKVFPTFKDAKTFNRQIFY